MSKSYFAPIGFIVALVLAQSAQAQTYTGEAVFPVVDYTETTFPLDPDSGMQIEVTCSGTSSVSWSNMEVELTAPSMSLDWNSQRTNVTGTHERFCVDTDNSFSVSPRFVTVTESGVVGQNTSGTLTVDLLFSADRSLLEGTATIVGALPGQEFGQASLANANPIEYKLVDNAANGYSISGTITTDGTIGAIGVSHILDWTYSVVGPVSWTSSLSDPGATTTDFGAPATVIASSTSITMTGFDQFFALAGSGTFLPQYRYESGGTRGLVSMPGSSPIAWSTIEPGGGTSTVIFAEVNTAALVEGRCDGTPDPTVTCDTVTGLEWLDLTETVGLSVNDFLLSELSSDWNWADSTMVTGLFQGAGSSLSGAFSVEDLAAAQLLLNLLGATGGNFGIGGADDGTGSVDCPFYQIDELSGTGRTPVGLCAYSRDEVRAQSGIWAYRQGSISLDRPERGFLDFETDSQGVKFSNSSDAFAGDEFAGLGVVLADSDGLPSDGVLEVLSVLPGNEPLSGFSVFVKPVIGVTPTFMEVDFPEGTREIAFDYATDDGQLRAIGFDESGAAVFDQPFSGDKILNTCQPGVPCPAVVFARIGQGVVSADNRSIYRLRLEATPRGTIPGTSLVEDKLILDNLRYEPPVPASSSVAQGVTFESGVVLGENVEVYRNVFLGEDATVGNGAVLNQGVVISAGSVIEDGVVLDQGVFIGAGAVIRANSVIGRDSVICSAAEIGPSSDLGKNNFVDSGTVLPAGSILGGGNRVSPDPDACAPL